MPVKSDSVIHADGTVTLGPKTWQRFWTNVQKTETCWNWIGSDNGCGYGRFSIMCKRYYPHRLIAAATYGRIADGRVVDHLCRNPSCVRPDHLQVVSMRENSDRGTHANFRARNTGLCRRGHSLAEHAYYRKGTNLVVRCRQCVRELKAKREAAA